MNDSIESDVIDDLPLFDLPPRSVPISSDSSDLMTVNDLETMVGPSRRELFMVFSDTRLRPPVFEEMTPDIDHLCKTIASKYTDVSCFQLQYEELTAEGWAKVGQLMHKEKHLTIKNRYEFFKYLKTTINNHVKGLVQRHRFTIKRTGHKPPAKGEVSMESHRPHEISLDDPNSFLQVGDEPIAVETLHQNELIQDQAEVLTPMEQLVYHQLIEHNMTSNLLSWLDAHRTEKALNANTIERLSNKVQYLAAGLGMDATLFLSLQEQVQKKINAYMEDIDKPEFQRWSMAVKSLSDVFELQIPRSMDKHVVKRILTLAARDQHSKVTTEVAEWMKIAGATISEFNGLGWSCFGILYEERNRICGGCGNRRSCKVQAANVGLGEITLAPNLLPGNKMMRIPAIVPGLEEMIEDASIASTVEEPTLEAPAVPSASLPSVPRATTAAKLNFAPSEWNDGLFNYLSENFRPVPIDADHYYRHKEPLTTKRTKYIFCLVTKSSTDHLAVRLCSPAPALLSRLTQVKNGFYIPTDVSLEEAIDILDKHAKSTFE